MQYTPMDDSVAPRTYTFKLKCPKCQKKVEKLLSQLNGEYFIKVEGEAGRVTVESTVNPNKLAAVIGEVMKEQQYQCEGLTPPPSNEQENNNKHMPVVDGNGQSLFKGHEVADLKELTKAKKLKQLEFTQTRKLRMTFIEEKNDGPSQKATPSKPKKADDPNHLGNGALPHESKAATGPTHLGACPAYCAGAPSEFVEVENSCHSAEFMVSYGGPYYYYSPPPYHHAPPPYHGYHHYPPPPYYICAAAVPSRLPPPAEANNDVNLCCDNESKCRMM